MKTVQLPIYENGVQLREYLEIDVTFFLSSTAGLRSNQARIVPFEVDPILAQIMEQIEAEEDSAAPVGIHVPGLGVSYPLVEDPVREQIELDHIDRIISGLPPRPIQYFVEDGDLDNELRKDLDRRQELLGEFVKPEKPELPYSDWRRIPGYGRYSMNPRKIIIDEVTDKTIEQRVQSGKKLVLLYNESRSLWVDVEWLFKKTFPELNK